MSGRIIFFLILTVILSGACEDPNTLSVSKNFSGNELQTVYMDTFSVFTSTVQLDSVLTGGTSTALLGRYRDDQLGLVATSTNFQISTSGSFVPDTYAIFDSAVLLLPYNGYYTGDTTQTMKINAYRITEPMLQRTYANTSDLKLNAYNAGNGFFNTTQFKRDANPLASATVTLFPHRDSLRMKLPQAFGANWFRLAKTDSAQMFSSPSNFITFYFHGLHLEVDPSTEGCVAGFSTSGIKIRMFYRTYVGDLLSKTYVDFKLQNSVSSFNNIQYDRSGAKLVNGNPSPIATLQKFIPLSSLGTDNTSYIQVGTGLVTRLDFPSVKDFFAINIHQGLTLNAAFLELYPVQGSYPKHLLPPSQLQLFTTDVSNMPLLSISGGTANIIYDYDYGLNTVYRYDVFAYLFGQSKAATNYITPLIVGPSGGQGASVQHVFLGDRFHINTRIKLKLFYTYIPTN